MRWTKPSTSVVLCGTADLVWLTHPSNSTRPLPVMGCGEVSVNFPMSLGDSIEQEANRVATLNLPLDLDQRTQSRLRIGRIACALRTSWNFGGRRSASRQYY